MATCAPDPPALSIIDMRRLLRTCGYVDSMGYDFALRAPIDDQCRAQHDAIQG